MLTNLFAIDKAQPCNFVLIFRNFPHRLYKWAWMSPVKDDLSPAQYLQNQDHLYQAFKSFWPQHSVNIARLTALLSNTSYCGQQTLLLLACLLWIWVWNTVFTVRLHTLSQHMFCFVLRASSSTCQAVNKKKWSMIHCRSNTHCVNSPLSHCQHPLC